MQKYAPNAATMHQAELAQALPCRPAAGILATSLLAMPGWIEGGQTVSKPFKGTDTWQTVNDLNRKLTES
jgi:hypothetical protein